VCAHSLSLLLDGTDKMITKRKKEIENRERRERRERGGYRR
jgi:hypothetical protein